jgi:hypothetical protein
MRATRRTDHIRLLFSFVDDDSCMPTQNTSGLVLTLQVELHFV